ncbi:hypothetical protein PHYSODRAFT_299417 [Phytophthora sojae]|uniref:PiggyBac transposable element-derived protein domain-containing protein n=1 Tax=Phytophthora sojae (strain P6497) TaxID=1094619 RepID=G4Z7R6_PHYSP|nr:hypothetical protein PHYSODRAFT_299417 [Phytophthora sojae]EGZ21820.1 hypothetical protein PHYSODRAFT_299417 [Phytophthora sojae]|eukprot:XP_009524537.1 hypothetical protein PHYSODRAFT_299417 [Phytophthora sojae]
MQDVGSSRGARGRQKTARTKQGPPPPPKTGRKTAQEDVGLEVEIVITARPATQSTAKSTKKKKPTPDPSLYMFAAREGYLQSASSPTTAARQGNGQSASPPTTTVETSRKRSSSSLPTTPQQKRRAIEMPEEERTPARSSLTKTRRLQNVTTNLQQAEASAAVSAELQQRLAISNPDVGTCFENIVGSYDYIRSDDEIDGNESADDEDESCLTNEMNREPMEENEHDWYLDEYGIDINDDDELLKLAKNRDEIKEWETDGWEEVDPSVESQTEFGNIYSGKFGPTQELVDIANSPLKLFWYFLPQSLWQNIADESNKYAKQAVITRARRIRDLHKKLRRKGVMRNSPVESLREIRQRLRKMPPIQPCELHVFLGLLIARALAPIRHRLSAHWSTSSIGAIPSGTFGKWMVRNRYDLSWNITIMYD